MQSYLVISRVACSRGGASLALTTLDGAASATPRLPVTKAAISSGIPCVATPENARFRKAGRLPKRGATEIVRLRQNGIEGEVGCAWLGVDHPQHFRECGFPVERLISLRGLYKVGDGCENLLFDHFVGAGEQRWRHGQVKRLRGLDVDDQRDFCGPLNRQVVRICTTKNPIDVRCRLRMHADCVGPI